MIFPHTFYLTALFLPLSKRIPLLLFVGATLDFIIYQSFFYHTLLLGFLLLLSWFMQKRKSSLVLQIILYTTLYYIGMFFYLQKIDFTIYLINVFYNLVLSLFFFPKERIRLN